MLKYEKVNLTKRLARLSCFSILTALAACNSDTDTLSAETIEPTGGKPNILWLVAEDLSAAELPSYGHGSASTPNLDKLAGIGTRFELAFATTPVCAPSRSSIATGMHNPTINAHNHRSHVGPKSPYQTGYTLPPPVRLIPEILRDEGYTTAIWGKTDYNFNFTEGYDYQFKTDENLESWSEITAQEPFFAQIHFEQTHRDWRGNPRVVDRSKIEIPPIYPDTLDVRNAWGDYLDELAALDRKIGEIVERLHVDGLSDNTVVIFISDHGREMPRGKQWVYDGGIHVPLIVWSPQGQLEPGIRNDLVSLVDVSASTLVFAGLEVPKHLDGQSFIGEHIEPRDHVIATRDRDDETFDRIRAVRTKQYKYIRNYYPELPWTQYNHYIEHIVDGQTNYETFGIMRELKEANRLTPEQLLFWAPHKPREELYDVIADPWETENLASDPAMDSILESLRAKLDGWIESPHPQLGWRDKGAVPEPGTLLFLIRQNEENRSLVDIVTTVDDIDGRDSALRVEYSLDNGGSWFHAHLTETIEADYGGASINNGQQFQISQVETSAAGANTIRFQWDTGSAMNGSGALNESRYDSVLIRTTQTNGVLNREPVVSTHGFFREFPAVVVDDRPIELVFD